MRIKRRSFLRLESSSISELFDFEEYFGLLRILLNEWAADDDEDDMRKEARRDSPIRILL